MKRFLKRLWIFLIPLGVYSIIVLIVDPYNYFFRQNFIPDKIKIKVINRSAESMPRGNSLWKYIDFGRNPCKNIIIGDSRAFDLDVNRIRNITGEDYFNFGVPGGNYNSIHETFWYVTRVSDPKKIYIQVGFHTYSERNTYNLMAEAEEVYEKPYLFFTHYYFFEESVLDAFYSLSKRKGMEAEKVEHNESTWNQIRQHGDLALTNMVYPANYYKELKKISQYCDENNIELTFLIFPDQKDFHDLISSHKLENEYLNFKKDIQSLGRVIDFDVPDSHVSADKNNYRDIFHLNLDLINTYIISSIWEK